MEKVKKTAKLFLCISLALMLLCGIVVSAVQTSGGDVVMKELNIETDSGYTMSAYLLIPKTATKEPAWISKEMSLRTWMGLPSSLLYWKVTWSN